MGFNTTLPTGLLPETDVEGMREFLSMLITPKVPKSMFTQVSLTASIGTFSQN